ncbi:hypothetical protein G5B40_07635 [Pikeienuella piscinae]|uniref:Yip1 domain-containing protein n=1 Tax=Pikeienuella piscinae TaxID=2748098 RepID=A0A7L5BWY4_9RHOB|nr:YIP1 family protein [Pikeienuella piscinae]QIE55338.1 hypothetical protein G5B40_07635 [Pikeienuella piscinae]
MLTLLIELLLQSYRAPRVAIRRVLDAVNSYEAVALIFGLAFALNTILVVIVAVAGGQSGAGLGFVASNLAFSLVAYGLAVILIHRIGAALGGRGSLRDIAATVAWHSFATVIFAPLVAAATLPDIGAGAAGLLAIAQLVMVGVVLWLLANFVAEAHGFASALRVAGGLFGGVFIVGFVLSLLLPNLISTS